MPEDGTLPLSRPPYPHPEGELKEPGQSQLYGSRKRASTVDGMSERPALRPISAFCSLLSALNLLGPPGLPATTSWRARQRLSGGEPGKDWARKDLNLQPSSYEPDALTD